MLHTGQPCYLNELIHFYELIRQLCSFSQGLLYCNRSRTVLALRGFKHSSVAVLNNLPIGILTVHHLAFFDLR